MPIGAQPAAGHGKECRLPEPAFALEAEAPFPRIPGPGWLSAARFAKIGNAISPDADMLGMLKRIILILLLATALGLGWLLFFPPQPVDRPGWALGPPMPEAFGELATVALERDGGGEDLVVLSGIRGFGQVVDRVLLLDAADGRWQAGPRLPGARHHAAAAAYEGAVVLSGGSAALDARPWTPRREVWRWRPGADQWQAMPPLPEPRLGHRMVALDDRLYVIGGKGPSARTWVYRPDHEGWAEAAPLPGLRDHLSLVLVDGRIWAIGGRSPESVARVDIYDPGVDEWQSGPALPEPTSGAAGAVVDGHIHIIGGEEPDLLGGGIQRRHWVLDPAADKPGWEEGPAPPLYVHGADGAVWDGRMVIAGGAGRHGLLSIFAWASSVQLLEPMQ